MDNSTLEGISGERRFARNGASSKGPIRMTIVDDSDAFVAVVADILGDEFRVTGMLPATADDLLITDPEVLMLDLSPHLDVGLSGWCLVAAVRQHDRLRNVPIIVCSGEMGIDGDVDRLSQYAGVHLLAKPFEIEVLEGTLKRALGNCFGGN